jgi:succinate dehydrogenase/fumarate reductase cytochrome b subunit
MRRATPIIGVLLAFSFYALYVFPYSSAISGRDAFDGFMAVVSVVPMLKFAEVVFILLLLVVHSVLAAVMLYGSSINLFSYPTYWNWMYALQRLAAIAIVPFILYHIFVMKFSYAFGMPGTFDAVSGAMANGAGGIIYLAGLALISFYLCSSAYSMFCDFGICTSRRSRFSLSVAMWVAFVALILWDVRIVMVFSKVL